MVAPSGMQGSRGRISWGTAAVLIVLIVVLAGAAIGGIVWHDKKRGAGARSGARTRWTAVRDLGHCIRTARAEAIALAPIQRTRDVKANLAALAVEDCHAEVETVLAEETALRKGAKDTLGAFAAADATFADAAHGLTVSSSNSALAALTSARTAVKSAAARAAVRVAEVLDLESENFKAAPDDVRERYEMGKHLELIATELGSMTPDLKIVEPNAQAVLEEAKRNAMVRQIVQHLTWLEPIADGEPLPDGADYDGASALFWNTITEPPR